jgi:serine protease Do
MNVKAALSKGQPALIAFAVILPLLIVSACSPVSGEDQQNIAMLRQMGNAFASVAEKASPGVVGIVAKRKVLQSNARVEQMPSEEPFDPSREDFFDFFFRRSPRGQLPERQYTQRAQASGFIISEEGHILTNNHVVSGADEVMVDLGEGRTMAAKVIGTDPESDVAIIKIDANDLKPVALGDSEALKVGEWVIAIGSPMGLSHTVTAGIVSAKGRSGLNIATYENFIQTDAAINMGNSGGPLINLDGQAVGINTAIVGPNGGNIGIGFAIPINMAKEVADQIIKKGSVERGYLGLYPQDLTPDLAAALGLKDTKGVVITQVTGGSPAAEAGVQRDDVVVQFGGSPVESASQFRNLVAVRKPGETVEMVVLRNGQRETLTPQMGKRPSAEELRNQQEPAKRSPEQSQRLGLVVQDLAPELAERYKLKDQIGVIITRVVPGSEAAEKGLRAGYVIKEVNRQPVNNVTEFKDAVAAASAKGRALLLVSDGQASQYVVLKVPRD